MCNVYKPIGQETSEGLKPPKTVEMEIIIDNVDNKKQIDTLTEAGFIDIGNKKFKGKVSTLQELFNLRNKLQEPLMLFNDNVLVLDYDSYIW